MFDARTICRKVLTSFSWVLIAFKREFPFDDVLRLWEVLWTDYYSNSFVLFIALAILESHRDMILRYLVEVCDLVPMTKIFC
jgi:TBC1 domain family member 15